MSDVISAAAAVDAAGVGPAQGPRPAAGGQRARRPRYRVEMTELRCIDETGINMAFSDEVVFACSSFKGRTERHSDVSRKFGNVDTGDRRFMGVSVGECPDTHHRRDPRCKRIDASFIPDDQKPFLPVIRYRFPEATPPNGLRAPFSVLVTGVEVDSGGVDQVKRDVEDIADVLEEAAVIFGGQEVEIPDRARARISSLLGNDAIGVRMVSFTRPGVGRLLPDVDSFIHTKVRVSGGSGGDIPFTGGGEYEVTLLVSRLR